MSDAESVKIATRFKMWLLVGADRRTRPFGA
jgi:hypothetical protein